MNKQETYDFLTAHGIAYEVMEHGAVYNMEDMDALVLPHKEALAKKGYGFMLVDNIKMDSDGLTYECHSSWFDNKSAKSSATKFKGYKNL